MISRGTQWNSSTANPVLTPTELQVWCAALDEVIYPMFGSGRRRSKRAH